MKQPLIICGALSAMCGRQGRFDIDAIVVLPDHIHCIWSLPEGDVDYSKRWGMIKAGFTRHSR